MSVTFTVPFNSRPLQTANIFNAVFNAPTLNRYDFGIAANTNQEVIPLLGNSIYIIERLNFSMDVAEANFQEAINVIPLVQLVKRSTGSQIFPNRVPFVNYVDNLEMFYPFEQTKPDFLDVTFTALLNQPAPLIGDPDINAFFQMNIYQVVSTEWNRNFWLPKMKLGENLAMRGHGDGGNNYS